MSRETLTCNLPDLLEKVHGQIVTPSADATVSRVTPASNSQTSWRRSKGDAPLGTDPRTGGHRPKDWSFWRYLLGRTADLFSTLTSTVARWRSYEYMEGLVVVRFGVVCCGPFVCFLSSGDCRRQQRLPYLSFLRSVLRVLLLLVGGCGTRCGILALGYAVLHSAQLFHVPPFFTHRLQVCVVEGFFSSTAPVSRLTFLFPQGQAPRQTGTTGLCPLAWTTGPNSGSLISL